MPLSKIQGINGQVTPNLGRRNMVINGAMKVAQRGTSSTGLGAASGYFTLDRFRMSSGSNAGRFTMSQSTVTDLPGFANALKLDCTTADTSTDAAENLRLQTLFEGQDLQQLKKGTSSAEKFTVSFYVKGNASATYMVEMFDGDNSRHNTQQFAVTSSWNRISLTFAGDTTGAFDDDNALSLYLTFWLHAGSSFTSGTYTANTWASNTNANRAVGISSFFDSTNRTLEITGLQMESGDTATEFEHRSFGEELQLCKRYYQEYRPSGQEWVYNEGATATHKWWQNPIKVPMRGTPTTTHTGITGAALMGSTVSSLTRQGVSADRCSWRVTLAGAAGDANKLYHTDQFDQDYIHMDAEL